MVVVGLLMVGWAVAKTSEQPDQIVIDAHEAIDFCAEALPIEVSSVLSYEDLRRILRLHLEWIQAFHWSPEGIARDGVDGPIVFEEFEAVDYILERADVNGFEVDRQHVAAVVDVHSSYLQVMGAIHLGDPETVAIDLQDLPLLPAIGTDGERPILPFVPEEAVADFPHQEEGGGPTA